MSILVIHLSDADIEAIKQGKGIQIKTETQGYIIVRRMTRKVID